MAGDPGQLQSQIECPQLQPARQRHPAGGSQQWGTGGGLPSPRSLTHPLSQIDFPTSAFDVKFVSPLAADVSPKYEFGSLGEEDQRRLREAMQKKSLYW